MARTMSIDETRVFLAEGTRTGALATVREDGRPHVAPVWFVVDGDHLVFTTHRDTVKAANLRRAGRAAIAVDMPYPPYAFVIVEGEVTISEDFEEMLAAATRIGGRYMGAEQAEAFGRRNAVPGELLVRLAMQKVVAQDELAAW